MTQTTWRAVFTTAGLVALFGAGAAAGLAWTRDSRQEQEGRRQPPFRSPIQTALDTDADGALSGAELTQAAAALARLDRNGDGALTREEISPAGRGPGGPGGGGEGRRGRGRGDGPGETAPTSVDELAATIMAFDKDGDGKVTRTELPERMQGILARADTNNDGALTAAEVKASAGSQATSPGGGDRARGGGDDGREGRRGRGPGSGRPRDPLTAALDTNGDGTIGAEEIAAASSGLRTLDTDFDGRLSAEEIRAASASGRRGRLQP